MAQMVFINLAVKDLDKSKQFYEGLGYTINPQFTDETASSVVISDTIYVMLMTEDKMREFTKKDIVDAHASTEVINALSCDSREEVDELVDKALSLGGNEYREADQYDFMYARTFEDPDGHQWEVVYMDMSKFPEA